PTGRGAPLLPALRWPDDGVPRPRDDPPALRPRAARRRPGPAPARRRGPARVRRAPPSADLRGRALPAGVPLVPGRARGAGPRGAALPVAAAQRALRRSLDPAAGHLGGRPAD